VDELEAILLMIRRLCEPLAFLHGEGIVHRDLKPGNIIIRDNGLPVIVDFGLMSWFRGADSRETLTLERSGTGSIHYISPEQILGNRVDARADIYSLGCILYELITGIPPFYQGRTISGVIFAHLNVKPVPPSHFCDSVTPDLDILLLDMLEKNLVSDRDMLKLLPPHLTESVIENLYPFQV